MAFKYILSHVRKREGNWWHVNESKEEASAMGSVSARSPAVLVCEINMGQEILLLPHGPISFLLVCGLRLNSHPCPHLCSAWTLCVSDTVALEDLQ